MSGKTEEEYPLFEPSEELLRETIRVWQPYYKRPMTQEDAHEIIMNMSNLVDLLARWEKEEEAEREGASS